MKSYCVFNVGDRRVGLEMTCVRETIDRPEVQPLPLVPPFFLGLFQLRGQVLPLLDLGFFVGAARHGARAGGRALVVERTDFRFATHVGHIDTLEADPALFQPLADAALFPALDAEAETDRGRFQIIHIDRLAACLSQAMTFRELASA